MSREIDAVVEDWTDRLNPIIVRELRQAWKSGWLPGWFILALVVCLSLAAWLLEYPGTDLSVRDMFTWYYLILLAGTGLLAPLSAFQMARREYTANSLELLQITPLATSQILFGLVNSAFLIGLLQVFAVLAFLGLAYLVSERNLAPVLFVLVWVLCHSYWLCTMGVACGLAGEPGSYSVTGPTVLLLTVGVTGLANWFVGVEVINNFEHFVDPDFSPSCCCFFLGPFQLVLQGLFIVHASQKIDPLKTAVEARLYNPYTRYLPPGVLEEKDSAEEDHSQ